MKKWQTCVGNLKSNIVAYRISKLEGYSRIESSVVFRVHTQHCTAALKIQPGFKQIVTFPSTVNVKKYCRPTVQSNPLLIGVISVFIP